MALRGRCEKRTRQRGAVLIEAAIIAPIAFALVFGAMELGYAYFGKLTVEHMSVAGARAASGSANDYLADYNTLQAVKDVPYGRWRDYEPEDTLRFYALRLHEIGMVKTNPNTIVERGADWRFLNELKRELKG